MFEYVSQLRLKMIDGGNVQRRDMPRQGILGRVFWCVQVGKRGRLYVMMLKGIHDMCCLKLQSKGKCTVCSSM